MGREKERDGGLRPLFHAGVRRTMWVPVETWAVSGSGVPDSWFIMPEGAWAWIEFKKYPNPLKAEQSAFLFRVVRYGGRAFVASRHGADELRLYWGGHARALVKKSGFDTTEVIGVWHGGENRWDWEGVRERLVSYESTSPPLSL